MENKQEGITFEKPIKYTTKNIRYHEPLSKLLIELKTSQARSLLAKAKKFLEANCISRSPYSYSDWLCKPLKNYNKTSYHIKSTVDGFVCTCQGFQKKLRDYVDGKSNVKPICSHVLAIKQYCFLESKEKKE